MKDKRSLTVPVLPASIQSVRIQLVDGYLLTAPGEEKIFCQSTSLYFSVCTNWREGVRWGSSWNLYCSGSGSMGNPLSRDSREKHWPRGIQWVNYCWDKARAGKDALAIVPECDILHLRWQQSKWGHKLGKALVAVERACNFYPDLYTDDLPLIIYKHTKEQELIILLRYEY